MSNLVRERSAQIKDFSGGLNNFWDPSSIAQNEVPFLQNLEFSPTGALSSRPPIAETGVTFPEANTFFNLLGYYIKEDGTRFGVFTSPTKTYVYNIAAETWTQIWTHPAADFVQYQGYLIMCRTNGAGAYWGPTGAPGYNSGTGLWTVTGSDTSTIATMPAGRGIELHQERLFLFGPLNSATQSVLYWSNISGEVESAPGQDWRWWDANNGFTSVNSGDGQWITGLVSGYNEVTVFRNASTYRFTFSGLPENGTMAKIQEGIGAENQNCIASYENGLMVLSGDQLYAYFNGNFTSLNDQRVRFEEQRDAANLKIRYAVSIIGSRAVVHFGGNLYVFQVKTNTWSIWSSSTEFAKCIEVPTPSNNIGETKYALAVSGSDVASKWKLYEIVDHSHSTSGSEDMECILRTRIFDFETPNEWKRLYWWAADVMAAGKIKARVFPVSVFFADATWDDVSLDFVGDERFTVWDDPNATWDKPTDEEFQGITTEMDNGFTYRQRNSLKLDNGVRFRRVYFELYLECDGTVDTSPAQIFSITPMIGMKAKMSDRIT
jgi:hypothetical protein